MTVAIVGYGAVGRAVARGLLDRGDRVVIVQRSAPAAVPEGAEVRRADATDAAALTEAVAGCTSVVCAIGLPYTCRDFREGWPKVCNALLDACAVTRARFVLADNLYMYGPQIAALREDMPLTDFGCKPRARAEVTRLWQAAHSAGRVRACAVRASDFYGPDAPNSVLVNQGIAPMLRGKPAFLPWPVDHPHAVTYVPDFAAAILALIDAPDSDYGQAWHAPNAPARSLRDILELAAGIAGKRLRIRVMPDPIRRVLGLFVPVLAELGEMRFQWDRAYEVGDSRIRSRFGLAPTPLEDGLRTTINRLRS